MIDPGPCVKASVSDSAGDRVWNRVRDSVWFGVLASVWTSVGDRVWNSLEEES